MSAASTERMDHAEQSDTEALVRLALEPDSNANTALQSHIARYRQLVHSANQEVQQP